MSYLITLLVLGGIVSKAFKEVRKDEQKKKA